MGPLLLSLAIVQTSVGPHGVRSGRIVLDDTGMHSIAASRNVIVVTGSRVVRTYVGHGRDYVINGNSNRITITGGSGRLVVNGNRNTVTIASVGRIEVPGNENVVIWSQGLNRKRPSVRTLGSRNQIVRR